MQFYGDYHTHSRCSDGRQNCREIIHAAQEKGLREIAITDHGPLVAVIGVDSPETYLQLKEKVQSLPLDDGYPRVYVGAEANIRDMNGTLDIPPDVTDQLDILIAGLHPYTMPTSWQDGCQLFAQNSLRHLGRKHREKAVNNNTKATVETLYQNPRVDILAHPGLFFKVDVEEVARACVDNEVLFEINCGHEHPSLSDIMKAERSGVDFIVNSDAHFQETVGSLDYGDKTLGRLDLDEDRIVNRASGGGFKKWGKRDKDCTYS
ncbi:PHP domain-containing protein [Syntrophomonas palmitatica]|uniref:PHP domain-containing protein n=1 Tax=Syntrophomonas palmitatica TaxID=402877 RepID=UPI0006D26BC2|nr:PHP domain-containing protein [Syntrophomonas palmitatica]